MTDHGRRCTDGGTRTAQRERPGPERLAFGTRPPPASGGQTPAGSGSCDCSVGAGAAPARFRAFFFARRSLRISIIV